MQLITILLTTVSVLTFLSGIVVFFGSTKKDRARSTWFLVAAIFSTLWMVFIASFLLADENDIGSLEIRVAMAFAAAIFMDVAFLGYSSWDKKHGKLLTSIFLIFGVIVGGLIIAQPHWFYSEVDLISTGNTIDLIMGPLFYTYVVFFATIIPAIIAFYLKQFLRSSSKRQKNSDILILVGYGVASLVVLICNLILPLFDNWNFLWLGPVFFAAAIISIYFSVLYYKNLILSSIWLRIFSYIVIFASIAILYMAIFSLIFAALFKGSTPSLEVIILNFIMVLIFIALTPAISSILKTVQSAIAAPKKSKEDDETS